MTDAYSRGAVSLTELLDAQNAFVVADEAAANAVYDFLADYIDVQRALGRFDALMTPEEHASFRQRLGAYAAEHGLRTPGR